MFLIALPNSGLLDSYCPFLPRRADHQLGRGVGSELGGEADSGRESIFPSTSVQLLSVLTRILKLFSWILKFPSVCLGFHAMHNFHQTHLIFLLAFFLSLLVTLMHGDDVFS